LFRPQHPGVAFGELACGDYERVAAELKTAGMIRAMPRYEEFHVPALP